VLSAVATGSRRASLLHHNQSLFTEFRAHLSTVTCGTVSAAAELHARPKPLPSHRLADDHTLHLCRSVHAARAPGAGREGYRI
jgi:hypothetical protein